MSADKTLKKIISEKNKDFYVFKKLKTESIRLLYLNIEMLCVFHINDFFGLKIMVQGQLFKKFVKMSKYEDVKKGRTNFLVRSKESL